MNSEAFHRKKTSVDMSIYNDAKRHLLNHQIKLVDQFLTRSNLPGLPNYLMPTSSDEEYFDDIITDDQISNATATQLDIINRIRKFGSDRALRKILMGNGPANS